MGMQEKFERKKFGIMQKNEHGSVTLFVLIAMIFFLVVGLSIFMSNMNNNVSQERDIKKIQIEYNRVDNGSLDKIYQEQGNKQSDKLLVSVTDRYGEIYQTNTWINADADKLPISIDIIWPKGISENEKEVKIVGTINGNSIDLTNPSNYSNIIEKNGNNYKIDNITECEIIVTVKAKDKTEEVKLKIDKVNPSNATYNPNGGEYWLDENEETKTLNVTITTSDAGSGVERVYYKWNNDSTNGNTEYADEDQAGDTTINTTNEVGEGVYYLHTKIIDKAGNITETVSNPFIVKKANYRIETAGSDNKFAKTLVEAVDECAENGSTIIVLDNITDNSAATISKNVILNTHEKELTMTNSVTVATGKTCIITGNGTITKTSGDLVANNGTLILNNVNLTAGANAISGGNTTVVSGTVTGGTNGINVTSENSVVTIGNETDALTNANPVVTGTTGYGVNISQSNSTLNFYNGKIVGGETTTLNGVSVAFDVAGDHNFRTGYGVKTEVNGELNETTLALVVMNVNKDLFYLNTTDNNSDQIVVTGNNLGTLEYTSSDPSIATVDQNGNITGVSDGTTTITIKDKNSGTEKTVTVIVDSVGPIISLTTAANSSSTSQILIITVSDNEGGSGLATNNEYKYYISTDANSPVGGEWVDYTSGDQIVLGDYTGERYVFVKQVEDLSGNKSTENGTIKGTNHVFGPYELDNSAPTVTFNPNGNTTYAKSQSTVVTAEDVGPAGLDTNSLKYQWTQSTTAPAENTFTQSFTNGGTITKNDGTGDNWYLWILAKDTVGNTTIEKSNPFYLDNTPPTYGTPIIENVTPAGYDVIIPGVGDEGSGIDTVKVIVWTTEGGKDDAVEVEAVQQTDGTTWKYHVDTPDHNNDYGEYNTEIKVIDNAENEVGEILTPTNVPGIKITFDANGGSTPSFEEVTKKYEEKLTTLPETTWEGHTFEGWWTDQTAGTQVDENTTVPTIDTTYYAHWTVNTYQIIFNKNNEDATGTMANQQMTYGTPQNLNTLAFARPGYLFTGWNTKADGSGTNYANEEQINNLTSENGVTINLYAQWVKAVAMFDVGTNVNAKIKQLSSRDNTKTSVADDSIITSIVRASTITDEIKNSENTKIVSVDSETVGTNTPIYMWFVDQTQEGEDKHGVIYWYTEAEKPYMNENGASMFQSLKSLTSIPELADIDTEKTTNMSSLFAGSNSVTTLDVSKFNTSNLENMYHMFYGCSALTEINVGGFNTSKVTSMSATFFECSSLTELDVSRFDTKNVLYMDYMFGKCNNITELDVSEFDTSKVVTMQGMFLDCKNIPELNVGGFNTSNVTTMRDMFNGCKTLTELDVSKFNTSNVTTMNHMFNGCYNITELDVSRFNTSNVTDMTNMFNCCSALTEINVCGFDTSKVTSMYGMFFYCSSLEEIDISNFNTSSVTVFRSMFQACSNLTEVKIGTITTGDNADMSYMFQECSNLEVLDLRTMDTSKVKIFTHMFHSNGKLKTIYATDLFIVDSDAITQQMFFGCNVLEGGNGTKYYVGNTNGERAWIDGKIDTTQDPPVAKEGYFTNHIYVEFDKNSEEATGTMPKQAVILDSAATLNINVFVRPGYLFTGWNTETDGSGTSYTDAQEINNMTTLGETVTLYAQWVKAVAMFDRGNNVNAIMKQLSSGDGTKTYESEDTIITSIVRASTITDEIKNSENTKIASVDSETVGTNTPIYMWFVDQTQEGEDKHGVIYWYTEAEKPYMNENGAGMFQSLKSLTSIPELSDINTEKTITMTSLFENCIEVTSLDVSNFNTSEVTNMLSMFANCISLTSVDVSGFDTAKVEAFTNMFTDCTSLTSITINRPETGVLTSTANMFNRCRALTTLNLSGFHTEKVTSMLNMFNGCGELTSLDVSGFNTSSVKSMFGMFCGCNKLTSLDLSGFDTTNVQNMQSMFQGCSGLTNLNVEQSTGLDLRGLNTENVTNMGNMFVGCTSLTSLDLSHFNTSKVTNFANMFSGCNNLISLRINRPSTGASAIMSNMFYLCYSLQSFDKTTSTGLDLREFYTENVSSMAYMFYNCNNLTSLDISKFNVSSVQTMECMFDSCNKLKTIYATDSFVINSQIPTNTTNMFNKCYVLVGGSGTAYSLANVTDGLYAKVDHGPESTQPGYFTNHFYVEFDKNAEDATGEMPRQAIALNCATTLNTNTFTRPKYLFKEWNTEADGSGTSYTDGQEINNLTTLGEKVTLYAQWKLHITKYAVQIYGISQDEDSDGNKLGLTFGPATGGNYNNSYVTHEYEETSSGSGIWNVKIITHQVAADGTETTSSEYLKNTEGNNVTRTGAQVTARENINIHEMTWEQILTQSQTDPSVFEDCMLCGDTKCIVITLNTTIVREDINNKYERYIQYGDGTGRLTYTVNGYYTRWNPSQELNSYVGTGVSFTANELANGSNAKEAGGYSSSLMRATLIGKNNKTNEAYAGNVNLTDETCVFSCLDSDLQDVITPKKIKYVTGSSPSDYTLNSDIADKLWVFSERELCGTGELNGYELEGLGPKGVGYKKFTNTESKYYTSYGNDGNIANRRATEENGLGCIWWVRSLHLEKEDWVRGVHDNGEIHGFRPFNFFGINFGFCLEGANYKVQFNSNSGSGTMADQSVGVGEKAELNANEFTKTGYRFIGWNTQADGNGTSYTDEQEVTNLASKGETITLYAQWEKILTKYAVQIYGIYQDVDETGTPLGLTFGPAVGANYKDIYVTHEYEETSEESGIWNVKIITHTVSSDGTETTSSEYLKNSSGNNVTRTTAEKNKYDINMHEMTWAEISAVADKTDFLDCMLCGDTKSVNLDLNSTISGVIPQEVNGDGAGAINANINDYYRRWNPKPNENSAVGTGVTLSEDEQVYGTNARYDTGYKSSHIRATLIGQENSNPNVGYAGDVNLTASTSLYSCIESDLQDLIVGKKVKYVTGSSISSSNLNEDINDKIWLFSEREVYGQGIYCGGSTEGLDSSSVTNDKGVGYDKFANPDSKYYISSYIDASYESENITNGNPNRVVYNENGALVSWWLRSVNIWNSYNSTVIRSSGQSSQFQVGSYDTGLSFGFCLKDAETAKYQVKFNANGGTGTMTNQDIPVGVTTSLKENKFLKAGYEFTGWNTAENGSGTSYTNRQKVTNLSTTNGAVVNLYAQWQEVVKYAVQIYGINQDVDENDSSLGLTFGPALGADYNNSYVTHAYAPAEGGLGLWYLTIVTHTVAADGTETISEERLKDADGNDVLRTTEQRGKYGVSIHNMTWQEIKAQSLADPTVFTDCMLCGDTKSAKLYLNNTIGNDRTQTSYGDGTSALMDNIVEAYYTKWNPNSTYNGAATAGGTDGTNGADAGGYASSHIRATLIGSDNAKAINGTTSQTNTLYAGDVNLDSSNCLYTCIEDQLRGLIGNKKIKYVTGSATNNYNSNSNIADKIWLFSEREIAGTGDQTGNTTEGIGTNGTSYDKFKNTESRSYMNYSNNAIAQRENNMENNNNVYSAAWLRSPNLNFPSYSNVLEEEGSVGYTFVHYNCGLAFGFCL